MIRVVFLAMLLVSACLPQSRTEKGATVVQTPDQGKAALIKRLINENLTTSNAIIKRGQGDPKGRVRFDVKLPKTSVKLDADLKTLKAKGGETAVQAHFYEHALTKGFVTAQAGTGQQQVTITLTSEGHKFATKTNGWDTTSNKNFVTRPIYVEAFAKRFGLVIDTGLEMRAQVFVEYRLESPFEELTGSFFKATQNTTTPGVAVWYTLSNKNGAWTITNIQQAK